MRRFTVADGDPAGFVERVREALTGRSLGELARIELEAGQIVVRFSRFGTTELRYDVSETGGGFEATLASEQVAPFHAPFRAEFEGKFEEIMRQLGAATE